MAESPFRTLNFKKDAFITVEGNSKADCFYIIRQGSVHILNEAVKKPDEEKDVLVAGDFFGVVSAMASFSQIETAQALSDVSLIEIKNKQYEGLIKNHPAIAVKIIQKFSKQLRSLNDASAELKANSAPADSATRLFDIGEHYLGEQLYNQAYYAFTKYMEYCPEGENVNTAAERKNSLAAKVKEEALRFKAEGLNRTYPKDAFFFCENEPGEEFFIIQKGTVKIAKVINGVEKILAILKAGDIFGEMAILENRPRSASAAAHGGECVAMSVSKANFETIIRKQPQIVSRLTTMLSERIWTMQRQLTDTLITEPLGRMYDRLLLHLEKNRVDTDQENGYRFDFTGEDLVKMAGLSKEEGAGLVRKLLSDNKKMQQLDGKLFCPDIRNIPKEVQFYRRMDKRKMNIGNAKEQ
jgi:CRP-like cAMP-binding protein